MKDDRPSLLLVSCEDAVRCCQVCGDVESERCQCAGPTVTNRGQKKLILQSST